MGTKKGETRNDWTRAEDDKLIRLWNAGVMLKIMILEMDRTIGAIKGRRKYLMLPARRKERAKFMLRINVDQARYDKINRRAREKGWTVAQYLRWIVERDTG